MKILDCTLRDGGYYNNWDFDPIIVSNYLQAMADSGIDYVELGFRSFAKNGFLGAFAYTTEAFLNELNLPVGPVYGVMVDAKTILDAKWPINEAVDKLFVDADKSKIDLVRIAAHFDEMEYCQPIVDSLVKKGYTVGFNLMQAGGKPSELITSKAKIASDWGSLEVLYFADSLGNMDSEEVQRIILAIRNGWTGAIGIHTHNNMAKALDNTLIARTNSVSWLDVTVSGMGRGAGNAQTENLLTILSEKSGKYLAKPVYELVIRDFEPLQKEYGWGSKMLYFIGAQHDVHPTYIQHLLKDTHYGSEEIVGAISYLSGIEGSSSYSADVLEAALNINFHEEPVSGSGQLEGMFADKEVLIVNNGPSLTKYLNDIKSYISQRKPIVLSVNAKNSLSDRFIDFYCVSHNTKYLSESDIYTNLSKTIILPSHRFTSVELDALKLPYLDYGLQVEKNTFLPSETHCVLPYDLTFAYALAVAITGKCQSISLVGCDGYESSDTRQAEMLKLLSIVCESMDDNLITALTPTTYPVLTSSIYAPSF
jgi:4-hydroxy 2-oxovalerate aldolase